MRTLLRNVLGASLSLAGGLMLAENAVAYPLDWTGAAGTDDYSTGNNWFNPSPYNTSFPPDPGSSLTIGDTTTTADVVMYSGSSTINDFAAYANSGPGGDTSFTIKSGASLHSTNNFDLGYYGGAETVTFTLEESATLDVDGYFGGGRPGPHTAHIYGTVNTAILSIGGADFIDFGSSGVIVTSGDRTSDVALYVSVGLFTAAPGYNVVSSFDENAGQTTISTAVPEPTSGLLLIGLAGLVRRCKR